MAKQTASEKKRAPAPKSKSDIIVGMLRRKGGATIEELAAVTGWQAHSVRGFLSGTVKKKLKLGLHAEKPEGGVSRYSIRGAR